MATVYEFNNLPNQVLYKNTEDILYYTNDPKELGTFEREWLNSLKKEITQQSPYQHNVLVNLTWFNANWDNAKPLIDLVEKLGTEKEVKIWYAGSIDGNYWITYPNMRFYHYLKGKGYTSSFVGFSDEHWNSWLPAWFIDNNLKVDTNSLMLNKQPKNLYLSYNRKPRIHREWLVNSLVENNVLDRGWVTFERGHYPDIDNKTGTTDQDKHSSDVRFTRPEDICSIGDLDKWRDSYMVIVSETDHDDPWQLSEKTWKPIFGMRPFLINGGRELYKILEKLDLYTPKDLFKNVELDCHYESVVKQIQALYNKTPEELYELWESQFEMLLYNRQRMFEIANCDPEKILNWPQAKSYSVPVLA
jgi:hypothetical protein